MVCAGLETLIDNSITGILAFPTSCDYWFYGKVMFAFWIIISFILFNRDKDKLIKPDMVSAMGVSAIVTIFVAFLGTAIKIIQADVMIRIFVIGMIFVVIWLIKR